jgi:hypothetical protein
MRTAERQDPRALEDPLAKGRIGLVARTIRYVLLCRHGRHEGGVLKPDKDTNRYPTQDVAERLREELLFGRQVTLTRLLYAPTPEARGTAWLLRRELSAPPPQPPPDPATPTAADRQRDPARRPRRLRELLTAQNPHAPVAAPETSPPSTGKPIEVEELTGEGEFTVCPPDWANNEPVAKQVVQYTECPTLSPARPRSQAAATEAVVAVTQAVRNLAAGAGVLIVGHMPQLSWLAYQLTRGYGGRWWKPWERAALPLASGEVACLAIIERSGRWSGHLQWAITPGDDEVLKSLYDKVKGKMESAKQLAAVITLVLSALLAVLLDAGKWDRLDEVRTEFPAPFDYSGQGAVQAAFGLLLGALALYLMTMYAYDRLLMPTRFWAELPPRRGDRPRGGNWLPRRPPSSSAWVVYRNMMRTWYTLFTGATALVALALAVLGAALLRLALGDLRWAALGVVALLTIRWLFRPVLGSED